MSQNRVFLRGKHLVVSCAHMRESLVFRNKSACLFIPGFVYVRGRGRGRGKGRGSGSGPRPMDLYPRPWAQALGPGSGPIHSSALWSCGALGSGARVPPRNHRSCDPRCRAPRPRSHARWEKQMFGVDSRQRRRSRIRTSPAERCFCANGPMPVGPGPWAQVRA